MFDLLTTAPSCSSLAIADYAGGFAAGSGLATALETAGLFPARYLTALSDALFYCELRNYILYDSILDKWMWFVVNNLAKVIMVSSAAFVTFWVVMAGVRLAFMNNREPILEMLIRGAKIVFVLSLVSGMTANTGTIIHTVLGLQNSISTIMTGSDMGIDKLIDMNIAVGQVMNMVVEDVVQASDEKNNTTGSFSIVAGLLGQSGPAVLTSVLVLLAQIAIVFALMLAPMFVFFLLFKETASLFWSWAKFLLGSFLSLCFLAIVSTIAMTASLSYGLTIMVSFVLNSVADSGGVLGALAEVFIGGLTGGGNRVEMSGAAMRLAVMGGLFSTLIVAVPPMIMQLFNASIGYASNLMGTMGIMRPMGQGAGGGQAAASSASGAGASGSPSALSGPAGGMAQSNNQTLLNRANSQALVSGPEGAAGQVGGARGMSGSLGLAAQGGGGAKLAQIQGKQSGDEFSSGGISSTGSQNPSGMKLYSDGTNVEDAVLKTYPHVGTGGALGVPGGGSSVGGSTVGRDSAAALATARTDTREGGSANAGVTTAPRSPEASSPAANAPSAAPVSAPSDTNVYATAPRGQMGAAPNNAVSNHAQLYYGAKAAATPKPPEVVKT